MTWLTEIDSAKSMDDLRTSRSTLGNNLLNFQTLDSKIAKSLKKILAASDCRKKAFIEGQKTENGKMISSRKTNHLHDLRLLQNHSIGDSILDFSDLTGLSLRGDKIQGFVTKWDEVLLSMKKMMAFSKIWTR